MNGTDNYNEQELLLGLSQGNEEAFTIIYNTYWKQLYFLAHKHLKSSQAAEEIVQDIFFALWNKRATIQIQSLPFYLAAMTRYITYRYIAKQKKFIQTEIDADKQQLRIPDQEAFLENRLLIEIVEKLTNQLPEKCRLVFIHNKLLDQPLQQVADEMNISVKTAEAHLTKALKTIRGNLGDGLSVFLFL